MSNTLIQKLSNWIEQRPHLDSGNYASLKDYQRDRRKVTNQLNHARILIAEVRRCIDEPELRLAIENGYAGRLALDNNDDLFYCAGQYWPLEYRESVCAICAYALWTYWRANNPSWASKDIHKHAKKVFGRGLASSWF